MKYVQRIVSYNIYWKKVGKFYEAWVPGTDVIVKKTDYNQAIDAITAMQQFKGADACIKQARS